MKTFIIDTNVLLADPQAVLKFEENNVVIPLVVLEEMDKQKSSGRDIARDARAAIRQLDSLIGNQDPIVEGIPLPNGGKLFVARDVQKEEGDKFITPTCNDDKIINICMSYQLLGKEAALVSNDINMRLKAKGIGLKEAQEYRNDIVIEDPDQLPKGYVEIPQGWLMSLEKDDIEAKSCGVTHIRREIVHEMMQETQQYDLGINDWLVNEEDKIVGQMTGLTEEEDFIIFRFENWDHMMARKVAGVTPQDIYQAMFIDALMDPEIDIVIADAGAGSGKTLLTCAAATETLKGKKSAHRMEEFIVGRTADTSFAQQGFLPGNESEKAKPWMGGVIDSMEFICRATKNKKFHPSVALKKGMEEEDDDAFIAVKDLGFMRGRSLSHRFVLVDEYQNVNVFQGKTIMSRLGEYSKMVLLGNNAQIDSSSSVTARSSALTYWTEKFHGVPFAKVIRLQGCYRSRVAEFVENNA